MQPRATSNLSGLLHVKPKLFLFLFSWTLAVLRASLEQPLAAALGSYTCSGTAGFYIQSTHRHRAVRQTNIWTDRRTDRSTKMTQTYMQEKTSQHNTNTNKIAPNYALTSIDPIPTGLTKVGKEYAGNPPLD